MRPTTSSTAPAGSRRSTSGRSSGPRSSSTSATRRRSTATCSRRSSWTARNGQLWEQDDFASEFVALTPDGAQILVDAGVRLIGVDYLSVGDAETHRILLGARIVCLEGLDLRLVEPGRYELFCGPIKLVGS